MLNQRNRLIRPGKLLPFFALPETGGGQIRNWDFHGRRNLVIVFVPDPDCEKCRDWLKQLTLVHDEIQEEEAEILVIAAGSREKAGSLKHELRLRGRVLADEAGEVLQRFGLGQGELGQFGFVIITDRYGEIYYETSSERLELPSVEEILSWLRFIESQCPE